MSFSSSSSSSFALRLLTQIKHAFDKGLALNHLVFTSTELHRISDPLLPNTTSTELEILYAPSLAKKPVPESTQKKEKRNPFLPYDPDCYITELSSTHVLLLNKFPIVENHVLIVPKDYLPQSQPLDQIDFENLSSVLQAFGDFIAYYNCGTCTGASVEHRHIQVIPSSTPPPLSTFICNSDGPTLLGFHYVWTRLTSLTPINLYKNYQDLLHQISSFPLFPQHNCLITKSWMMLVPRSKASAFGISINAMGYTGCVLVDTQEKLTWLKDHGVLKLLQEVGVAIPATT